MLRFLCRSGRRRFAVPSRRCQSTTATVAKSASVWSSGAVLGIAVATGAVGWSVARWQIDENSGQLRSGIFSSIGGEKRFATLSEMNKAKNEQAIDEIVAEIGNTEIISTDHEDLTTHGYSEWSTVNPETLPVAVAYPRSTEDVATIARICHKHRVPLIPYSGGTSLEGNFSAPYGGVSVDFAHMDRILQLNKDDMDVVVQPSIGWQDLNRKLADAEAGLFFPVDPGPTAKIGGMIGTNCSGTNAVRYGTMKDWVINLTVVLADGRVIKTRRRPRKSSAGYNLNGLFVGSEGTLGIVTEGMLSLQVSLLGWSKDKGADATQATLKLAVIPETYSVGVVSFPTIRDAAAAAAGVMQAGVPINCLEIMDDVQMRVVNLSGSTAPRTWKELPTLFFKFAGSKASVAENISTVQAITARNGGADFAFAEDEQEQKVLWSARKESLWSMLALRKDGQDVWSTDVAVPLSRLADLIEVSKKEMDDLGMFASILGHVGDGNFHESIMYSKSDAKERDKVARCVDNMVNRALNMEGTCTGEHSIGWGKKVSLVKEVGQEAVDVMATIKQALDPRWILNPGKIMDVPWMPKETNVVLADVAVTPIRKAGKQNTLE
ncbi:D-lactate dehydrogenase [Beauveria brongniartii RCEF 3172]|uniref:D-lactate dehydrogenase (cytochrome) n=1 Tax=Beauveria brongniartii RCEF 3172 TaxID=1081107 RepID=A0A167E6J6_9HYPO|nr:D-lactate dehydrogenase [Beauveria brongniartii RCEF 3172]